MSGASGLRDARRLIDSCHSYFLSPFVFTIFGTPVLLKLVPERTPALALYRAVWGACTRFIRRATRAHDPSVIRAQDPSVEPGGVGIVGAVDRESRACSSPPAGAAEAMAVTDACGALVTESSCVAERKFTMIAGAAARTSASAPSAATPPSADAVTATWGFVLRRVGRDCMACSVCSPLQVRDSTGLLKCVLWGLM